MKNRITSDMIRKRNRFLKCSIFLIAIFLIAVLLNKIILNEEIKSSRKTLKEYYFSDSNLEVINSITKKSGEVVIYSNYKIRLDSYIYDSMTDTGYARITIKDTVNLINKFDLQQNFYETFEFKFMHQGHYFETASPRITSGNNCLYLYYKLKKYGNRIIIWDIQSNVKAAEFVLENTCENNKKLDTSDGKEITISPIGIKILTGKSTASSEFVYDETKMSEEDLKEYFNDGISQVDILYKNGNRVAVYGGKTGSSSSEKILDGKIERTIMVSKIIDVDNVDTIEIK